MKRMTLLCEHTNSTHEMHERESEVAIHQLVTAAEIILHTQKLTPNKDRNKMTNATPGLQREQQCVRTFTTATT
jgi:hypothetical protein